MKFKSRSLAGRAAVLLLIPAFLVAGCQKQNNSQPTHEKFGGGRHQGLRIACADDIQKYCANVDRKRRCLRENMDKLSDTCKATVGQRGGRRARDKDDGGSDE